MRMRTFVFLIILVVSCVFLAGYLILVMNAESPVHMFGMFGELKMKGAFLYKAEKDKLGVDRFVVKAYEPFPEVEYVPARDNKKPFVIEIVNLNTEIFDITSPIKSSIQVFKHKISCRVSPESWRFSVEPKPMTEIKFFHFGNVEGSWDAITRIKSDLMKEKPHFAVCSGSLVERASPNTFRMFERFFESAGIPLYTLPGEKDKGEDGTFGVYERYFGPQRYSLTLGNTSVIMGLGIGAGAEPNEVEWLKSELIKSGKQSGRLITIGVVSPLDPSKPSQPGTVTRLLKEYGVQLAIYSHGNHGEAMDESVKYLVSGGGGGTLQGAETLYHYNLVTVKEDGISTSVVNLEDVPVKSEDYMKEAKRGIMVIGYLVSEHILGFVSIVIIMLSWFLFSTSFLFPFADRFFGGFKPLFFFVGLIILAFSILSAGLIPVIFGRLF